MKYSVDHIGDNVRQLRSLKGWNQDFLGAQFGISGSYVSQIEQGQKIPRGQMFLNFCQALECEPNDLFARPDQYRNQ